MSYKDRQKTRMGNSLKRVVSMIDTDVPENIIAKEFSILFRSVLAYYDVNFSSAFLGDLRKNEIIVSGYCPACPTSREPNRVEDPKESMCKECIEDSEALDKKKPSYLHVVEDEVPPD